MQKLYCYVDETGHDTLGRFFLVVVIISDRTSVEKLRTALEQLEEATGKQRLKWNKTPLATKSAYIEGILGTPELKGNVFYSIYHGTQDYVLATAHTVAWSVSEKTAGQPPQVNVLVDGITNLAQKLPGVVLFHRLTAPFDKKASYYTI